MERPVVHDDISTLALGCKEHGEMIVVRHGVVTVAERDKITACDLDTERSRLEDSAVFGFFVRDVLIF